MSAEPVRNPEDASTEEIVRVGTASSIAEAYAWRQALRDEGVECKVVGEYLGGVGLVPSNQLAEVWVHVGDFEKARSILKQWLEPT